MTTSVTIAANHGWPVDVTAVAPLRPALQIADTIRVPAGATRVFCVHSGQDLLVHEVQPHEIAAEDDAG